ncbi:DUF389 domain-containing protein [Novosphingobium sp. RD2P27]|uniref:DUF389 domain-containing protein n=1 Tax=Novosphingobium kalidii TaxID=3230299 RepID=A0ABV2CZE8_9SPHN
MAAKAGATDVQVSKAHDGDDQFEIIDLNIGNSRVEQLVAALEHISDVRITFAPRGVVALRPPSSEAAQQVVDVEPRSPLEVFLSGLQSVGSWTAFLSYAAAAGIVVWIGLFAETIYLLTAAMLIAPFASPAMNAALATARGDASLFGRSLLRYGAALAVCISTAFVLSMIMRQQIATQLMVDRSLISSVAVLLPLVAGAAGALNLCQSERSSLVTGAATGMLVAASLAPPAGLVGMGAAIGEWDIVKSAAFLLILQIAGINVAGAIVFRIYGVTPRGVRLSRGSRKARGALWSSTLAVLGALVVWQMSNPPELLRSSTAQRATQSARSVVDRIEGVQPVQVNASFTRADIPGQNTLLVTAYVQSSLDEERVRELTAAAIKRELSARYKAIPLVSVTVLKP